MGHRARAPVRATFPPVMSAPSPGSISAAARRHRNRSSRGQSLAEFSLLLPVMLAFLGLTLDFARVFQAWITIESATRDAAELAATSATSSANAQTLAQKTVCLQAQNVPGYRRGTGASPADIEQCATPNVSVVNFSLSTTAAGASSLYPIGTATVQVRLPFSPLFPYPFITQDGTWTIVTQETFSIVQGRE